MSLVTEEDVLELVDLAEEAWSEALEARKKANALSEQAERDAEVAAAESQTPPPEFTRVAQISEVLQGAIDAGDVLAEARDAITDADCLEAKAEQALKESEEALERHVVDFPESPLKD